MNLQKTLKLNERLPCRYRQLVRPATMDDALDLAPRVRRVDRQEIKAHSGMSMEMALRLAVRYSSLAWSFLHPQSKRVHVMAGLNLSNGQAAPWASGAPFDFATMRFFISVSNYVIAYMFQFSPVLANMVDARNRAAIKWLGWEGFKIHPAQPFGAQQRLFHKFTGYKEDFCHV